MIKVWSATIGEVLHFGKTVLKQINDHFAECVERTLNLRFRFRD